MRNTFENVSNKGSLKNTWAACLPTIIVSQHPPKPTGSITPHPLFESSEHASGESFYPPLTSGINTRHRSRFSDGF